MKNLKIKNEYSRKEKYIQYVNHNRNTRDFDKIETITVDKVERE